MMAAINTRVVRRSNALLGHAYGKRFRYSESMLFRGRVRGAAAAAGVSATMGAGFTALAMSRAARRWVATKLPSSGEGPSREAREAGFFKLRMYGVLEGDASATLLGRITGQGDPGYAATSRMLGESALCLALDPLRSAGGVQTPSVAMGQALLDRLRHAGLVFAPS